MQHDGHYDESILLHRELLKVVFFPVLHKDITLIWKEWNHHLIRKQRRPGVVSGVPDLLYFNPARVGALDFSIPVEDKLIETVADL